MGAPERPSGRTGRPAEEMERIDYSRLSNEQLRRIFCEKVPHMAFLSVTDENRQTVIAMLEVTEKR